MTPSFRRRTGLRSLALIRYALAEISRGHRRTASAVVGVSIVVAFLAGTSIAIDSSLYAILAGWLSRVDADFLVQARTAQTQNLSDGLRAVPGVVTTIPFREVASHSFVAAGPPPGIGLQVFAIDPGRLPRPLDTFDLVGTMVLPRGSATVTQNLAGRLALRANDTIELWAYSYNATGTLIPIRSVNLTVEGILVTPDDWSPYTSGLSSSLVAIHLNDADWLETGLTQGAEPSSVVQVSIDRGAYLNPYDLDGSRRNLARLGRELGAVVTPYGGFVSDEVSNVLPLVELTGSRIRDLFLALSAPIIVLGLYVGAVGVDLAHAERRRHLAILKTRGASSKQILGLLLVESLIGGTLAAGLGLAVGVGISRVLVGSVASFFGPVSAPTPPAVSRGTIALTVLFATAFMFLVSYRSAKRTAGQPAVEALRFYVAGESKVAYRPYRDIVLLAVGAGSFLIFLARRAGVSYFDFFVDPLPFLILPIAPFLIALGLVRLSTRASSKPYEWAARIFKPLTGTLHYLVARNLGRNPRRASSIAVVLALGLSFGIIALSMYHGSIAWEDRKIRLAVGADLAVIPPPGNPSFNGSLASVPGVVAVTAVEAIGVPAELCSFGAGFQNCPQVFALDAGSYFQATLPEPWYFTDGDGEAARRALSIAGDLLASQFYLSESGLKIGDHIAVPYSVWNETSRTEESGNRTLTIAGVVRGLPGMPTSATYPWQPTSQVFGSFATLNGTGSGRNLRLLADLADGTDWRSAKRSILKLGAVEVRAYEEERAGANTSPAGRAFLEFLGFQGVFLVAVLVAGLVLITFAASLEREAEFAAITARGASGWQTARILLGEASSILLIGIAVGLVAGVLAAYVGATVLGAGPGGEKWEPVAPFPFIIPIEAMLFVADVAASLLLAALLVSWRIAHMDVPRILRTRAR